MTAKGLTTHNKELFHKWLLKNHKWLEVITDEVLHERFHYYIDELQEPVVLFQENYKASAIIQLKPTSYRCMFNDWSYGEGYYDNIMIAGEAYWCKTPVDELIEMFLEEQEEEEE